MPVNDFEKKVQQKMDELQLRPSADVWTEVEKRIRKDKKRRVLFFWLPLAALFLGGVATVWIITSGSLHNDSDKTNSIANQQTIPVTNKNTESTNNTDNNNDNNSNQQRPATGNQQPVTSTATGNEAPVATTHPNTNVSPTDNQTTARQLPVTASTQGADNRQVRNKQRVQQDADAIITIEQANTKQQKRKTQTEPPVVKQEATNLSPTVTIVPDVKQEITSTVETSKPGVTADVKKQETTTSIAATQQQKTDSANTVVVNDKTDKKEETLTTTMETTAKPKTIKLSRKKWQFSLEIQAGGSDTEEGGVFSEKKSLVYANPFQNGVGSSPVASAGPFAPPILVSSPDAGFSAGIKLEAERQLSRRLSVQGGIGYTYLSTTIEVGNRINLPYQVTNDVTRGLVVESFYGSSPAYGSASEYVNRFHLLGISAGLSWKFIDKKKLTVSWDNNISANRLLSTNALLFDRTLRGYYKDFNAYRKTQIMFTTGLTVPVLRHNRLSAALHPFAAYGITPVLKTNSGSSSHFLQYGLGLKFSWLQKK